MRRATLENRKAWEHVRAREGALAITVQDFVVG